MLELAPWSPPPGYATRVGVIATYPPTRCGIGRFTASLIGALTALDSSLDIDAIRLTDSAKTSFCGSPVTMEIDPSSPVGIRAAARHLNRRDVAIINHEFGIFGPNDGIAVVDLARQLEIPSVTILHTVLPDPTSGQRAIISELAELSTPVVICEAAARILADRYDVDPAAIDVIPHGALWPAQRVNHPPRRELITWGLLGPGKGLERAIEAVAQLNLDPPVRYRIVGRTHPNVVRNAGYVYRDGLRRLVNELGVEDRIEFVDRYVDDDELMAMVVGSDVVVVPYDNHEQVSSGVITEAVGLGRPVVATRFPYAEELLASGAGRIVDHDAASLANATREMLDDPVSYGRAARTAAMESKDLEWSAIAVRYSNLVRALSSARATA